MDRSERIPDASGLNGTAPWTIIGQGLAGTCLAWRLWERGEAFTLIDREEGGSSRVAAGLINPVTGKNFEPSKGIATFLPEAVVFYQTIESKLGTRFWHPMPVLRLASTPEEWNKIVSKRELPTVTPWLAHHGEPIPIDNWVGAIELSGGGRLDTRTFLDQSREFFRREGIYQKRHVSVEEKLPRSIWCEGALGLMAGKYGPHRCAKGEILTITASGWDQTRIRIGAGGWLIPIGHETFKAGATYEWNHLDESPTPAGLERVSNIASRLGGPDFQVIGHEAGVRPILRRSEPLIGPLSHGAWMFNGLGSKGSLYAPGMASRLADWLLAGIEPDPELDFRNFQGQGNA